MSYLVEKNTDGHCMTFSAIKNVRLFSGIFQRQTNHSETNCKTHQYCQKVSPKNHLVVNFRDNNQTDSYRSIKRKECLKSHAKGQH